MFTKLRIQNWRQFERVEIDFHRRLTILTGANGSGKTTLLHLLNRHWGWNLELLSGPRKSETKKSEYWSGFWGKGKLDHPATQSAAAYSIGELIHSDGLRSLLSVPSVVAEAFAVDIQPMKPVNGVYVSSHRPPYVFKPLKQVPVKLEPKEHVFGVYVNELIGRYKGQSNANNSPSFQIKRALISLAMFGYGNAAVERDEDAVRVFEGFQEILRTVLPESLRFREFKISSANLFFATDADDIPFEAVSGGIAAIVDMVWQIFMYAQLCDEFVVVIDEPEAHLHPALQQRLLPDLLAAFPKCQFVIATHNPFMVTSVADSNVFVLRYNAANRVESELLDSINKSGTADEILLDVLGVPSTLPQWAKNKVERMISDFTSVPLTRESMSSLRSQMTELGMAHLFPQTLAKVAEGQH